MTRLRTGWTSRHCLLGEFGDDPNGYAETKYRRNYAGTSPIERREDLDPCLPATFTANVSPTRSDNGHFAHCELRQGFVTTTTSFEPEPRRIAPQFGNRRIVGSGSCTSVSSVAVFMMNRSLGIGTWKRSLDELGTRGV